MLTLGVSGAWIGSLTALEPHRPIFIGLTLLFLAGAFHSLFWHAEFVRLDRPVRIQAYIKGQAPGILDLCNPSAWSDRHALAGPAILSTMRSIMNRFILLIAVVALPLTSSAGNLETVALNVKNMTCALCPITVKKALEKVPGVIKAEVDFDKKAARVTFDSDKTSPTALTKATSDAGYPSAVHN